MPNAHFRSRDLLDAVYAIPCQFRLEGVCVGGISQPCHSNWSRHGKGKGIKAHDCFVAAGCPACHRELDQGTRYSREERQWLWQQAFENTLLLLFQRGVLVIHTPSIHG